MDNNPVHEAMLSYWGERCTGYHEECVCCKAWEQYDGKTSAQRPWVGLTDEEISNLWSWSMTREAELTATTQQHAFARAIEAKLKEHNA
jgi:hypothetical protein